MTALITPEQSAGVYALRGLAGEQPDEPRCGHCDRLTEQDELIELDHQHVCAPCAAALTGDDLADRWRDL